MAAFSGDHNECVTGTELKYLISILECEQNNDFPVIYEKYAECREAKIQIHVNCYICRMKCSFLRLMHAMDSAYKTNRPIHAPDLDRYDLKQDK